MYAKVSEAPLGIFLFGMVSTVALMTAFAISAVLVMVGTTLASIALLNYVPDHTLAKGTALLCTVIIGLVALPTFIEWWERKFIVWSWKNGL